MNSSNKHASIKHLVIHFNKDQNKIKSSNISNEVHKQWKERIVLTQARKVYLSSNTSSKP